MLRSGVGDESIKFTNKGDVDVVAGIYKRAFLGELHDSARATGF